MNWSVGFSASYYIGIVDPLTWLDSSRIEITGGSISISDSDLRQSADVDCLNYSETNEQWIRIWMATRQEGSNDQRIPLFTGIASSPDKNINGAVINTPLQCYSVLKPAEDVYLPRGWYAPVDIPGDVLIEKLLQVTSAPMIRASNLTRGSGPKLKRAIVAENNETNLSMIDLILNSMNWCLTIDGEGIITIGPKPDSSSAVFSALENDILEPSVSVSYDWFSCPNVLRVDSDDMFAIARDDREDSLYSTVNRGREVWAEESGVSLADNESISSYALRRLKELQKVLTTISYTRRFNPDYKLFDIITLDYPRQKLSGDYRIKSQNITLGSGAKVSEEVEMV